MGNFIDKPLSQYDGVYKDSFHNNCKELFDKLVSESGVDKEANKKICAEYYKVEAREKANSKFIKKLKTLRAFMIVAWIVLSIVSIALCAGQGGFVGYLKVIVPIVLSIISICLLLLVFKPRLKNLSEEGRRLTEKLDKLKNEALSQISSLFSKFSFDIPKRLIEKTVPNIKFDDYFDLKRYFHFVENYGMSPSLADNKSTLSVVSGEVNENPFMAVTSFVQTMKDKVYVGTLTIHWTTTERDSQGRAHTQHHTQVLHAESIHPVPTYYKDTTLVYASDAAPDLSFSRKSSNIAGLSDKEIERKIDKFENKAEKKAKKSVNNSGNFTVMSNSEFEALFGAIDRDNEVQFRLLFTPLAQLNEVETIRDKKYFGDDFTFVKKKRLNYIKSTHSRGFDFSGSISAYNSFDIDKVENNFISYNEKYFENLYFDMIPLLNIPLYQQLEPIRSDDKLNFSKCGKNYNCFEIEALANVIQNEFSPIYAKTPSILKTKPYSTSKDKDVAEVSAFAFNTMNRIDYISVFGGDGHMHLVPVPWQEYIPIVETHFFEVCRNNLQQDGYTVNQRGFKARII